LFPQPRCATLSCGGAGTPHIWYIYGLVEHLLPHSAPPLSIIKAALYSKALLLCTAHSNYFAREFCAYRAGVLHRGLRPFLRLRRNAWGGCP
jgi:hypothetical protein